MSDNRYNDKLIAQILLDVSYPGKELHDFEYFACLLYDFEDYSKICSLIKTKEFLQLKDLYKGQKKTFADLSIIRFKDEMKKEYTAIFYDSDELWQDPELWEIIPD